MHADTIDPKLDDLFDNDEIAADGLSSPPPPPAGVTAAGSAADPAASAGAAGVAVGSSAVAAATAPADPALLAAAPAAQAPPGVPPTLQGAVVGERTDAPAASAAGSAGAGVGAAGDSVVPADDDPGKGAELQASSLIPSDPVLAMQMGARLALTGEFKIGDTWSFSEGSTAVVAHPVVIYYHAEGGGGLPTDCLQKIFCRTIIASLSRHVMWNSGRVKRQWRGSSHCHTAYRPLDGVGGV